MKDIWFLLTTHRKCSWCNRWLRWAPLAIFKKFNTTHTICKCCKSKIEKQIKEAK